MTKQRKPRAGQEALQVLLNADGDDAEREMYCLAIDELRQHGAEGVSADRLRALQRHAVLCARDLTQIAATLFSLIPQAERAEQIAELQAARKGAE